MANLVSTVPFNVFHFPDRRVCLTKIVFRARTQEQVADFVEGIAYNAPLRQALQQVHITTLRRMPGSPARLLRSLFLATPNITELDVWDPRVQLVTDDNWDELIVNEELTEEEEERRTWFLVMCACFPSIDASLYVAETVS